MTATAEVRSATGLVEIVRSESESKNDGGGVRSEDKDGGGGGGVMGTTGVVWCFLDVVVMGLLGDDGDDV